MHTQTQKIYRYTITGRGGQGVFFLSKVIARALLLDAIENFTLLKECDEGQRNGEIKITFGLPFKPSRPQLSIKKHNMVELRKVIQDLGLKPKQVKKALQEIKPKSFKENFAIWQEKRQIVKKLN